MKDLRKAFQALFDTTKIIPGDAKERQSFFDHTLKECPEGANKIAMSKTVRLPKRNGSGKDMRIPIAFPEKLRENMRKLHGVTSDEEYNVSTTAIVLADFAARMLLDGEGTLVVTQAKSGLTD